MSTDIETAIRASLQRSADEAERMPAPPLDQLASSGQNASRLPRRVRPQVRIALALVATAAVVVLAVVATRPVDRRPKVTNGPTSATHGWRTVSPAPVPWSAGSHGGVAVGDAAVQFGVTPGGANVVQTLNVDTGVWHHVSSAVAVDPGGSGQLAAVVVGDQIVFRNGEFSTGSQSWAPGFPATTDPNDRFWFGALIGTKALFLPAGLAYDTQLDRWIGQSGAPTDLSATNPVSTGRVVIGAARGSGWWSYDPTTGGWSPLPRGGPGVAQMSSAWDRNRLVVLTGLGSLTAYDPATAQWTVLSAPDIGHPCDEAPQLLRVGARLVVRSACGRGWLAVQHGDRWTTLRYPAGSPPRLACPAIVVGPDLYDPCANVVYRP